MPRRTTLLPENVELVERAILAACGVYGVTRGALLGQQRSGDAWSARAALCYALHGQGVVWRDIGIALGREHSAPRAVVIRLRRQMANNQELRRGVIEVDGIVKKWARGREHTAAA